MIMTRVPDVVSLPCKVVVAGHMAINNCTKSFVRECQVVCSSSSGDSLIQGDENGALTMQLYAVPFGLNFG